MTAPSIRTELAAAIRRVNVAFNDLSPAAQASIEFGADGLEQEIDAAILADDCGRALAAVRAWRSHWLSVIEEAAQ